MTKFKEMITEETQNNTQNNTQEKTLMKEVNKRVKMMKSDLGTNNFYGAVESLKGLLEDYLKNQK